LHLVEEGIATGNLNATISGLRFFYNVTLNCPDVVSTLTNVHEPRRLPEILNAEEVASLINESGSKKYQAALSVAYGAGLRRSEVTHLKISDIDSERMVIRVDLGKGKKDRYAMLSPSLGARLGVTSVLHTWGSALTHHPHLHRIVPGGGLSPDKQRWVRCRTGFFLPVRVLSRTCYATPIE